MKFKVLYRARTLIGEPTSWLVGKKLLCKVEFLGRRIWLCQRERLLTVRIIIATPAHQVP